MSPFRLIAPATKPGYRLTRPGQILILAGFLSLGLPLTAQSPVIDDIPDQQILEGELFAAISLDDLVEDIDHADDQLTWNWENNHELSISITDRVVTVSIPDEDWYGSETITFVVTDPESNTDSDEAVFTVDPVNDAPVLMDIPDVSISEGGAFDPLSLDLYVTDVDNLPEELIWNISGNTELAVAYDTLLHVVNFSIPDENWNGQETLRFDVTDPDAAAANDEALYTVLAVNDAPLVGDIPGQSIAEGGSFDPIALDNYIADVDNLPGEMVWNVTGNTSLTVSIDGSTRIATISTPDENWFGSETLVFTATDPGAMDDSDDALHTVTAVNDAPLVTGIPDQSISVGGAFDPIPLDNYVSDVDNTPAELTWSYSGNTNLTVLIDADRVATLTPQEEWTGAETLTFIATDPETASGNDNAQFSVMAVNAAPTDISLSPASVNENAASGTQVGTFSTADADAGDSFTYTLVAGTGDDDNGSFAIVGDALRTAAVFNYETKSSYTVRVRSTDSGAEFIEESFTITITDVNEPPTDITLSGNTLTENLPVNTVVGTLSASDPDAGSSFTFSLVAGTGDTDNGSFNISGNQLRSSAGFDFETQSTYTVRIRVSDGTHILEEAFSINVTNLNEEPTDIELSNNTIAENQPVNTVVGTLSATDPDAGSSFTFSLVSGSGDTDNGSFNISGNQLRSSAVFDFETKSSYAVRIQVSDGSLTLAEPFTITVTFDNEAPTDITLSSSAVQENLPANTVVGTLTTTDPNSGDTHSYSLVAGVGSTDNGSFNISGNQLRTSSAFDFEAKSSYSVRIRTTDNLGATYEEAFSIAITNVNEAPTDIALSNSTIAENQPVNTVVGTLSATDPDAASSFTFSLVSGSGDTDNGSFNISGNQLRSSAVFDFETKSSYAVRIQVSDGSLAIAEPFTITVTFANEAPTDITLSSSAVLENQPVNTLVGTLTTTDPNSGDTHTYSLVSGAGSTDNASFTLAGNQLRTAIPFNYETKATYSVRIRTTDSQSATYEEAFTITITDDNEAPVDIVLSNNTIAENQPVNTVVGTLSAIDPDIVSTFTYTLVAGAGSTDNASFNISGNQLRSSAVFDFETKSSYSIRIRVSDGLLNYEEMFSISVTFANEPPTDITLSGTTVQENLPANTVVGTLTTTDPNSGDLHSYSLVPGTGSTDNGSFNISGNQLRTGGAFDYETKASYAVRIRTTDNLGATYEEAFTITVTNVNEIPTDIILSNNTIPENQPVNTVVGTLSATDPDAGSIFTFTLVSGAGSTDNSSFNILGNQLRSSAVFDVETQSSYSIRIRVSDGSLAYEEAFTIVITNVNDAPVLDNIELASLDYTEGDGAVLITGTVTVTDPDSPQLSSATIQITSGFTPVEDVLGYTPANGITGSYSSLTGLLTLTGTATQAQYQAALRRVSYENINVLNPSTVNRIVTFTVSDGSLPSNAVTRAITINSTNSIPVISGIETTALSYCPRSGPKQVTGTLLITDTDNTELSGAIVRISGGFVANEDYLRYSNFPALTENFNPVNGTLTVTGVTTLANYQAFLRSVQYENTDLTSPTPGTRTITFTVNDGTDNSNAAVRDVVVNPLVTATFTNGLQEICNDGVTTASFTINFSSGTGPWDFVVNRYGVGGQFIDSTVYNDVADPYPFTGGVVMPYNPTLYRIKRLNDNSNCPGDTTGTGTARVSYGISPTAAISGIDTICPGDTAILQVALTGTGPWSITYLRNTANPVVVSGITASPYLLEVMQTGTYTLSGVTDINCTGLVSGEGIVRSYSVPTASISGTTTICEHTTANLNVALTGASPWKFSYRRNAGEPVEIVNVLTSPRQIPVQQAGTYTLYEVFDKNCKGTVSGSATITVTPAPEVELSGLAPAYNKQSTEWVLLTGTPPGGTYTGPGVIPYNSSWYFVPSLPPVGTHNIVYSYRTSPSSCYGYDTVVVRILEASALIEFENNRTKYCRNDAPFTVTGVNLADVTGSFTISGGIGLVDHGDNTATVSPALLSVSEYTITYTYYDGTVLSVNSKFDVGNAPLADFKWESECFTAGQSIQLTNASTSTFGNLTDTSYYWKIYTSTGFVPFTTEDVTYTFSQPGVKILELQIENTYGCSDTVTRLMNLRPTIALAGSDHFEQFDSSPVGWQSETSSTIKVNSWQLGNPIKGFSAPSSGANCWYTYIPSYPAPREQSWITSPCFDFTGTDKPMLKMDLWRLFNSNRDGANVQASADSGKTWMLVGQIDDGIEWFNSYNIIGNPGGSSIGWSNNDLQSNDAFWVEARHALDMLKGKSRVQFRIAYGSDLNAQGNNGIAFDDFWIGERNRTALLEHFTNSSDGNCVTPNLQLNTFVNENGQNVIDLQYHTSFPGSDPFNQYNPTVPGARVFYYGLADVPYTVLNGGPTLQHRFDYDIRPLNTNTILVEALRDSEFAINLDSKISGSSAEIVAQVYALKDIIPARQLTVHLAVIEQVVAGVTGNNGETSFESVVKALLPDAAGTTLYQTWNAEEPRYITENWDFQSGDVYDYDQLRVVAFIQDEATQEVYQAAIDTIGTIVGIEDRLSRFPEKSFVIFPNPAQQVAYIEFDQETTRDITIELYNNLGGLVWVKQIPAGAEKTEIPVEEYPDGLYLLRLISHDQLIGIDKLNISR